MIVTNIRIEKEAIKSDKEIYKIECECSYKNRDFHVSYNIIKENYDDVTKIKNIICKPEDEKYVRVKRLDKILDESRIIPWRDYGPTALLKASILLASEEYNGPFDRDNVIESLKKIEKKMKGKEKVIYENAGLNGDLLISKYLEKYRLLNDNNLRLIKELTENLKGKISPDIYERTKPYPYTISFYFYPSVLSSYKELYEEMIIQLFKNVDIIDKHGGKIASKVELFGGILYIFSENPEGIIRYVESVKKSLENSLRKLEIHEKSRKHPYMIEVYYASDPLLIVKDIAIPVSFSFRELKLMKEGYYYYDTYHSRRGSWFKNPSFWRETRKIFIERLENMIETENPPWLYPENYPEHIENILGISANEIQIGLEKFKKLFRDEVDHYIPQFIGLVEIAKRNIVPYKH